MGAQDAGEADWNPAPAGSAPVALRITRGGDRSFSARDGYPDETSTAFPRAEPDVREVTRASASSRVPVPVPASLSSSFQVHSSPSLSAQLPPLTSAFDKNSTHLLVRLDTRGDYDHVTVDELRDLCRHGG